MKKLLLLLLLITPLLAEDEIIIHLPTQKQLIPIAINWNGPHPQLKEVLSFDLAVNGINIIKSKAVYHVDIKSSSDKLLVKAYAATALRGSFEVPVASKLSQDRRSIHQLADAIQKSLFGTPGIATTSILYTVKRGDIAEVWCADYDGGNRRQITHDAKLCVTPAFLPPNEGSRAGSCFYVSYRTGQPKIYIKSVKGGPAQRLTHLRGNQLMPAISGERNQVAFVCDATGNPDLFLQEFHPEVGAIGKPRHIFTAPRAAQGSPTFSPNGKELAFVSNKDGTPRIYIMDIPPPNAKSTDLKPKMISKKSRENTSPNWSPDGTKIAYSSKTSGVRQIWIYEVSSGKEWQLTDGPTHKENPCWAPNSLHLIFNSATRTSSELYLVNLNHPKAIKITSGPGQKRFPSWQ